MAHKLALCCFCLWERRTSQPHMWAAACVDDLWRVLRNFPCLPVLSITASPIPSWEPWWLTCLLIPETTNWTQTSDLQVLQSQAQATNSIISILPEYLKRKQNSKMGCPVKIWISDEQRKNYFKYRHVPILHGTKKILKKKKSIVVYLKFQCNWASCISAANPHRS